MYSFFYNLSIHLLFYMSIFQALLKSIYIYYVDNCFSSTNNQKSIESLVAELLVDLCFPWGDKPPLKRSFGPLREITLAPLSTIQTLPYTSDNTYRLLKIVGKITSFAYPFSLSLSLSLSLSRCPWVTSNFLFNSWRWQNIVYIIQYYCSYFSYNWCNGDYVSNGN